MKKIFEFEFLGSVLQFSETIRNSRDLFGILKSSNLLQGPDCENRIFQKGPGTFVTRCHRALGH